MRPPDEAAIAGMFRRRLRAGPPEDVGSFRAGGVGMAAAVDTLVRATDVPPGMGPGQMGAKAVTACVSDFAAKGLRPEFGVVSVSLPRGTTAREAGLLASGIGRACSRYGVRVVGGDTNEGEASVTVCLLGRAGRAVPRGGAASGDAVFVTGPFGLAAAGLDSMLRGGRRFARHVTSPVARLEFGVENAGRMSAAMDSSDGLAATLHGIAGGSGARIVVDRAPAGRGVAGYAGSRGLDPDALVFYGGEEYEIVFTARPRSRRAVMASAGRLGVPALEIGRVERGSGVYLERGGARERLAPGGWRHLG